MRVLPVSIALLTTGLLIAAPALAQTSTPPASTSQTAKPHKQRTDGNSPPMIGPGSAASKQHAQSLSHAAFKQRTQSLSHEDPGSTSTIKN